MEARKIKNSRGEDTIEVIYKGISGSSPGGRSKSSYESKEFNYDINKEIESLKELSETLESLSIDSFDDFRKIQNLFYTLWRRCTHIMKKTYAHGAR